MQEFKIDLKRKISGLNRQEGLSAGWQVAVFVLALLAIFSRDTSLFTHAQFFAEDGKVWYAQAYNGGWLHSLTIPYAGYLSTVQRLGAGLAMLVPFRWAPLAMMLFGLLVQALPVPILLSARCRFWTSLPMRMAFAAIYVAIPDAHEIHVVCTNSQWHLCLVVLLLALAAAPRGWRGRLFDLAIVALSAVSGPFCILLLPFVLVFWWVRRQRWSLVVVAMLAAGSVLQLVVLSHNEAQRITAYLGATPSLFVKLLGGDVFLGALFGSRPFGIQKPFVFSLAALVVGVAICAYFLRFISLELRLFTLYCFLLFAAELHSPAIAPVPIPLWAVIVTRGSLRYWFFPSLPFLFAILWCAAYAHSKAMRVVGAALVILLLAVGVRRDWRIRPLPNLHFERAVAAFEAARPGTHLTIPLNPPGWQMDLTKKN